jgi:excisionase family DNA binding protein
MEEELLTTPELCKWLKISRGTAWRWREEGMPYIGQGKSLRYRKADVLKWLDKRT